MTIRYLRWLFTPPDGTSAFLHSAAMGYFFFITFPPIPLLLVWDLCVFLIAVFHALEKRVKVVPQPSRLARAKRAAAMLEEDLQLAGLHDDPLVKRAAIAKAQKKHRDTMAAIMREA